MYIFDHLSPEDREIVFAKIARFVADDLRQERAGERIYKGQAAVAKRLNCSVGTVGRLMAEQRLGYARGGTKGYVFTEQHVLDYLQGINR